MELILSICLGAWIALSGIVGYLYYKNDDKRGHK